MAKSRTSSTSTDGTSSQSVTTSNRFGSRTTTISTRRTRDGFVATKSITQTKNSGTGFVIVKIVLLVMLTLSVFSLLFGNQKFFGFETLLNAIAEVPAGDLSGFTELVQIPTINSDWGIIDGLRGFLNVFINTMNTVVSFVCYLGYGFLQCWSLIFYFLGLI